MTTPLPQGLLNVVSVRHDEPENLQPIDKLFARQQILYRFWKVHHIQAQASNDVCDKRSEQLFWRILSYPRLRDGLREASLQRLWQAKQAPLDLRPFELDVSNLTSASASSSEQGHGQPWPGGFAQHATSIQPCTRSTEPQNRAHITNEREDAHSPTQDAQAQRSSSPSQGSQNSNHRPTMQRTSSSGPRKRNQVIAAGGRGKTRPTLNRRASSRTGQATDVKNVRAKPKSPRSSVDSEIVRSTQGDPSSAGTRSEASDQLTAAALEPIRRISTFELGSASSWQSVEDRQGILGPFPDGQATPGTSPLRFSKEFRNEFRESLRDAQSSLNLAKAGKSVKKTGSVVRFADDVDKPTDLKAKAKQKERLSLPEGNEQLFLQHRDSNTSTGSQAVDSDDEKPLQPISVIPVLQRTRSQISIALEDERKDGQRRKSPPNTTAISSMGKHTRGASLPETIMANKTEEEKKVLIMAHREGVTKAGGVQFPKHLRVSERAFHFDEDDDSLDEATF